MIVKIADGLSDMASYSLEKLFLIGGIWATWYLMVSDFPFFFFLIIVCLFTIAWIATKPIEKTQVAPVEVKMI